MDQSKDVDFIQKVSFKQWWHNNQIGIYITIIFHLIFFLYLSLSQLKTQLNTLNGITRIDLIIDPELEPEKTPEELEAEQIAELEKELNAMLNQQDRPSVHLPNIAVNAGSSDASGGLGEGGSARNLTLVHAATNAVKPIQPLPQPIVSTANGIDPVNQQTQTTQQKAGEAVAGPSVISYFLANRSAIYMPVPAYKCKTGGDVTVLVEVNKLGYVLEAVVDRKVSSKDDCLQEAAIKAALTARFTVSTQGLNSQQGNIVYRFIPQTR